MQTCPHCNESVPYGMYFCEDCGEPLSGIPDRLKVPRNQVVLAVGETRKLIELEIQGAIVLGRAHETKSYLFPLERHEAYSLGVSRNHAVLTYQQGEIYVRDLGSRNHTFLNDEQLLPDSIYRINHRDVLRLGWYPVQVLIKCATTSLNNL